MAEPKYLAYGSINPFYLAEQEEKRYNEQQRELYNNLNTGMESSRRELVEAIMGLVEHVATENNNAMQQPMVTFTNEYEEKFNFVKAHSGSEEDRILAMKIVGLL